MTHSGDRLDRIEALLDRVAESQARAQAIFENTQQIVESNARAIEAWSARIDEGIIEAEEITSQMVASVGQRIADLENNTGVDRVRFDALHKEHDRRFTNLLEEARADRQRSDLRFSNLLEEARADRADMRAAREANATEHRAFTQNIQTLLAEIARLWQRVAS